MNNCFMKYWTVQFPFCKLRLDIIMAWNMTETRNRICSVCCNNNAVFSSLMTYHRVCSNSIMTGLHVEHHLQILPREYEFTPVFNGVHVAGCLVFCVMFYRPLFVLWSLFCLSFDLRNLITPFLSSNTSLPTYERSASNRAY